MERDGTPYNSVSLTRQVFERTLEGFAFDYEFYDDWLDNMYRQEEKSGEAVRFLSLLAILLSCLGLFGLAEYGTKRRIREIGIRKVNGARAVRVMLRLNFDFLKWLALAAIIACPVAW